MWCFISQPNSVIFEVHVDPKAIGQDCLEKVCEHLNIAKESDYFGLKYEGSKGEELWLNLRNPIQVPGHSHTSPLRFALRVKFWVPPHLLLQESTRHQFYLHARLDLMEKRLLPSTWECLAKLMALIAQAEVGDYNPVNPPSNIYVQASNLIPSGTTVLPNELLHRIIADHKSLSGMKSSAAEYWLLKEVSTLESFGEEMFHMKPGNIKLGVGPHGITKYEVDKEKQIIPFTAIQSAASHRRVFKLDYVSQENVLTHLETKLESNHAASSLYRAITEKHAFYSCETVRSAVTEQFIRDLKGTIVSIFNEDSSLGKKYVFDIRRTCREVYDNARRALYVESQILGKAQEPAVTVGCEGTQCKDSHERLTRLLDSMICKICMDNQIEMAFFPCAHVVACMICASKCERCPLCRADIKQSQKVYLPAEFGECVY